MSGYICFAATYWTDMHLLCCLTVAITTLKRLDLYFLLFFFTKNCFVVEWWMFKQITVAVVAYMAVVWRAAYCIAASETWLVEKENKAGLYIMLSWMIKLEPAWAGPQPGPPEMKVLTDWVEKSRLGRAGLRLCRPLLQCLVLYLSWCRITLLTWWSVLCSMQAGFPMQIKAGGFNYKVYSTLILLLVKQARPDQALITVGQDGPTNWRAAPGPNRPWAGPRNFSQSRTVD